MGQHRYNTIGKIHTRAPFKSLSVKGTVLLHIISDIRDMHAQDIIAVYRLQGDSIVQVLRILAVYRHHQPVTQVFSSRSVCFAHFF